MILSWKQLECLAFVNFTATLHLFPFKNVKIWNLSKWSFLKLADVIFLVVGGCHRVGGSIR